MVNGKPNFENQLDGGSDLWDNPTIFEILSDDIFEPAFVPVYQPIRMELGYLYASDPV